MQTETKQLPICCCMEKESSPKNSIFFCLAVIQSVQINMCVCVYVCVCVCVFIVLCVLILVFPEHWQLSLFQLIFVVVAAAAAAFLWYLLVSVVCFVR